MLKVLIICNNEISYNPRLLKTADFLSEKGVEVSIFNPITGIVTSEVYHSTTTAKGWVIIENDICKRTALNYINWVFIGLIHRALVIIYRIFKSPWAFEKLFNKGLILNKINLKIKYDYVIINLVDNLPFAAKLKKLNCNKIIYDSQEFFVGQYQKYDKSKLDWVIKAENMFINDVDILIATTEVMKERIVKNYSLTIPAFRVRNVPSKRMLFNNENKHFIKDKDFIYLVWHGMTIFLNNTRGVHILVQAIAACKSNVKLVLQGSINKIQEEILNNYISKLNLEDKIILVPPANPYIIVDSLRHYDVGLIGEIPEEENQVLTSSNKLFDFINAGLAVIAPDLPGLNETVRTFDLGLVYPPANIEALANQIDKIAQNPQLLEEFKTRAIQVAKNELFFEHDFHEVWKLMSYGK